MSQQKDDAPSGRHNDAPIVLDLSLFDAITDASPNTVLVIDERGIIQAASHSVLHNFNFAQVELLGQNLSVLLPEAYNQRQPTYLESFRNASRRRVVGGGREVLGQRKDGSYFPMQFNVNEFQLGGQRAFVGVCYDISERHRLTKRITQLATYDDLTGCINRHQFVEMLEKALGNCQQTNGRLGLLFIDLDGFKNINDSYGHGVGDRLLKQVAERLRLALRGGDILGRVGGDEFVAFLLLNDGDKAEQIADRLIKSLQQLFDIDGVPLLVSASIGISLFPEHGRSADKLINAADIAMYRGKSDGGGEVRIFSHEMREENERNYRLVSCLREALELGQFELHYQLQFDTRTFLPSGLEALIRWHHGDTLFAPGQFIAIAQKYRLMPAITRWVIRQACVDNAWLIKSGILDVPVAVNVCVDSFVDEQFVEVIQQMIKETGLPPERLVLEITEDVAMTGAEQAMRNSLAFRRSGIRLAMDDFGTGYSSLGRLRSLQFHKLKIDRSFVAMLPGSTADQEIVRAILSIARALGMQAIAEGIETREQLAFLQAEGCHEGQGYWFARPMPLEALITWVEGRIQ
ncbi:MULTISPECIES: bifunctional diguanylate cyclase/phosphodiesterase [unclassified Pseudomonas]|uniref:putative bifunctional diguanylate cyclase/phosphodiesterase n=1 Tax=unclassified Pseudomonas TaxID=196821 RepID=UPI000A1F111D|nr:MULTISPECIES: EAL domain-containing protein [unclassified Pseudomonas]